MIPDEVFAALQVASAQFVDMIGERLFADGSPVEALPAAVTFPNDLSLFAASVTFDGHTAEITPLGSRHG